MAGGGGEEARTGAVVRARQRSLGPAALRLREQKAHPESRSGAEWGRWPRQGWVRTWRRRRADWGEWVGAGRQGRKGAAGRTRRSSGRCTLRGGSLAQEGRWCEVLDPCWLGACHYQFSAVGPGSSSPWCYFRHGARVDSEPRSGATLLVSNHPDGHSCSGNQLNRVEHRLPALVRHLDALASAETSAPPVPGGLLVLQAEASSVHLEHLFGSMRHVLDSELGVSTHFESGRVVAPADAASQLSWTSAAAPETGAEETRYFGAGTCTRRRSL